MTTQSQKHTDTTNPDIDFRQIVKQFHELNSDRLARILASLPERQRDFIELLPLLFHINHPLLPGFVSKYTPAGVFEYEPDRATINRAKRIARSVSYRRSFRRKRPILAIYAMGSPGTVAYAEGSDIDIWVCHDPKLDRHHLEQLQGKTKDIEAWASQLGLEAHLFLINPESFRQGKIEALSSESSGTAQHNLLLEEFYRTGILLAGQKPIWWLVPPEKEAEYDSYVASLKQRRFIHARNTIDLGGIAHIPAEEFFGAALWQLYKGVDSPYKSILKLLLIEAYASEYPEINLLSYQFKKLVYRGERDLNRVDPYTNMLDKVSDYLKQRGEAQRLELARRCFYFKANLHLSTKQSKQSDWRHDLLMRRTESWGWGKPDLLLMDRRDSWKVERVTEERRILFEALSSSYRFLSEYARKHSEQIMIDQKDLTILGRKLYASFERKAGKVDILNRGITTSLREDHLSLHEVVDHDHQSSWLLFNGMITIEKRPESTPLKRSRSLVDLLAWCYFNRILDQATVIGIYAEGSTIDSGEIKQIIKQLYTHFPYTVFQNSTFEDFASSATLQLNVLYINVTAHLLDILNLPKTDIVSSRADALCYGLDYHNLVMSIDMVFMNSWQEVLTQRYTGSKGLPDALCNLLKWSPPSMGRRPVDLNIHVTGSHRATLISQRIETLFSDIVHCYYDGENTPETRYLFALAESYCLFYFDHDTPRYELLDNLKSLIRYLASSQARFSPVLFDRYTLTDSPLPLIYERNREGYCQLFYYPRDDEVEIFVLDERGSLFHQRLSFHDEHTLVIQYSNFFDRVRNRINFLMQDGESGAGIRGVEFYRITKGAAFILTRQPTEVLESGQPFFSLQVMVDTEENGTTNFTLFCEGREFSTLEFGDNLFNTVVRYILHLRHSGHAYPIYITDISFSPSVLGEEGIGKVQTLHYLDYKRRIEKRLNDSLMEL